jgi:hypothetical protein
MNNLIGQLKFDTFSKQNNKNKDINHECVICCDQFKINDNVSLNNIIRNHNIADVDSSIIKSACSLCTQTFGDFFMIDMKTGDLDQRFRHNFLGFLDLKNPQLL